MHTEAQTPSPLERVGDRIRQARQEQNRTLDEAAAHTRISRTNLRAIEDSAYERLPADSFTRGLLLLYAEYLGLDGRSLAEQFFLERDGGPLNHLTPLEQSRKRHALEPKKLAEQPRLSSAVAAAILLGCIVVSLSGFCLYSSWNPFAYLTDKAHSFTSTVKNTFHPADPATSGLRNQTPLVLQALFRTDCHVLVALDNHPATEQLCLKGSTIQWEAEQSMQLDFLQADCAELLFNGSSLPFPPTIDGQATLRLPVPANVP